MYLLHFFAAFGRKVKRLSDVNAMGYSPGFNPHDQQNVPSGGNMYPNLEPSVNTYQQGFSTSTPYEPQMQSSSFQNIPQQAPQDMSYNYKPSATSNLDVFAAPMVQDMALQYGQQLAGVGTSKIKNEVEKFVSISELKYYFAVDTKYVLNKLWLLFFPFTNKDWSIKYKPDAPIKPRYEVNAPDLYIPTMAYITYVLVAGYVLGMQDRFTPEQLGILASSALAWICIELVVYYCTLYILQVQTMLRAYDMLAYSGYKFVGIIFSILISLVGGLTAYYCVLIYANLALAFFLTRNLRVKVLAGPMDGPSNYYDGAGHSVGHRRKVYFLLCMTAIQPVLSWWLSYSVVSYGAPVPAVDAKAL
ncbi:unnamed protein product [Acanthoscelides obtectus]|uniref:Protein YIF1 n=1 Tax=Acanthoscelides obtectus TaxID=200917 RepID=A0A9P0L9G5_ACAOB|nr:unnamed protein product [Acanthoscelides obtectus]CAK1664603.1 Protein YIF1A [Acanthoscelides obtectus]